MLLAIFPLTTALQRLGNGVTWQQALIRLRPLLLILSVLLFLQQIGELAFSNVLHRYNEQVTLAVGLPTYLYNGYYAWGDFAAAMVVLAVPMMALFYWLVPRIDRNLINHWRPM